MNNTALELSDGAQARLVDGALELRDEQGRLQIRYRDGVAEVCAPSGDLVLGAPQGRVVLVAGTDVAIEATRDVTHTAGRTLSQEGARIHQRARELDVEVGRLTTAARSIVTTAATLAQNVERYELSASRMVERARNAFREVSSLMQTRAGRLRTIVSGTAAQHARRTLVTSDEDTALDGKRVLLG